MVHLHSALRYLILIALVITIVNAFLKMKGKKPFAPIDDKLSLITFILSHMQLLLGLALYFIGAKGMSLFANGMGEVMKTSVLRFFAVEHIFGMLIAIVLITMGRVRSKKQSNDVAKHKTIFVYYLIALIIIIVSIPWPFRGFGQAWF